MRRPYFLSIGKFTGGSPVLSGPAAIDKALRLDPCGVVIFAIDNVRHGLDMTGLINSIDAVSDHGPLLWTARGTVM
jgi:hypothetical protein